MIAVGGWTFNDPGATQTRFSDVCEYSRKSCYICFFGRGPSSHGASLLFGE
jgi:hypothetical protein